MHCEKSFTNERCLTGLSVPAGRMAVCLNFHDKTVFLILLWSGEIDIIEGVNDATTNQMTLHTGAGCTMSPMSEFPPPQGAPQSETSCASTSTSNTGCAYIDNDPQSYGAGLNKAGGAVFVMLWDANGIAIWRFPRNNIPQDITSKSPDPSSWGAPVASWGSPTCPSSHFFKHSIVFDTTLCGDWAKPAYNGPGTCESAVADPKNFISKAINLLT
jgi:hypothetical protein